MSFPINTKVIRQSQGLMVSGNEAAVWGKKKASLSLCIWIKLL
jgi:hypothetical protein